MATKFLDHEAVHFVAGRFFVHHGKQFFPGEVIEDARDWKNLESMVRSRWFIPVVEDQSVLPTRMQYEVKVLEDARARLNYSSYLADIESRDAEPEPEVEPEEETSGFDPSWTISKLMEYLEEHPQDIKLVLERERENQKRPRLIKQLEERLAIPDEEEIDV
jgi:hypothetical protein